MMQYTKARNVFPLLVGVNKKILKFITDATRKMIIGVSFQVMIEFRTKKEKIS